MSAVLQIVGRHPDLLLLGDALLDEVRFTTADEGQRVGLAVELGEVELLESGRPIVVMAAVEMAVAGHR